MQHFKHHQGDILFDALVHTTSLLDAIYKELAETRSPVFTKAAVGARAVTAGLNTALELRTGALVSARRLEAHLTLGRGLQDTHELRKMMQSSGR
jgi:hypothetical protein